MRITFLLLLVVGCATAPSRFPAREPLFVDKDDFRPYTPPPEEHKAATIWDGVDESMFRPLSGLFAFPKDTQAANANSLDEVPSSSWFTNRERPFTHEQVARGACDKPIDPKGPFEVLSTKPDGFNPGFLARAKDGRKYFFKFDQHALQPERMSMAEVVGSLIYHAVGFTVPCYEILFFDRNALIVGKDATMKDKTGKKVPMTEAPINEAFRYAKLDNDGKVRAVASLLLEGKPLGPWTYAGTADDDPNDVVPHEDRREVRSGFVLASWISHFDTRDQNTLRTWIPEGEGAQGYVRHNILDFGDSMGNLSDYDHLSRRLGYAHYVDFPYFMGDLFTFGFIERPWDRVKYGAGGPVLGYYDIENFDPESWRPGYPNPAFKKMNEADAAWMARQIAEFRDEHLKAIVERAKLQNQTVKNQLLRTLSGRRDKLLKRWFRELSPLSHPQLAETKDGLELCLRDLATYANVLPATSRRYETLLTDPSVALGDVPSPRDNRVCVNLKRDLASNKSYLTLAVRGLSPANPEEKALHVHLAKVENQWTVVGVER